MFNIGEKKLERDRIAVAVPPDWRRTKILNNEGGIVADVERLSKPDWWNRPAPHDHAGRELSTMLRRSGLGGLTDTTEQHSRERNAEIRKSESGEEGITTTEIAARQRDRGQRRLELSAGDEEEEPKGWQEYLANPRDDARQWLAELAKKLDMDSKDNSGWSGTLRDHVNSKPAGARVSDLNPELVELCVRALCTE